MIGLPILLIFLGGKAFGQHASRSDNHCFSSSLAPPASYKACCGSMTSGTDDLDDTTFDYTCNSFLDDLTSFEGHFSNAYSCVKQCADTPQCAAAVWNHDSADCWYTTSSHAQKVTGKSPSYMTFENKRPRSNPSDPGPSDCKDLIDQATSECENAERKKCNKRLEEQEQDLLAQCDRKWTEKCNEQKAQLTAQCQSDQARNEDEHRRAQQALQDEVDRLQKQLKDLKSGQRSDDTDRSKDSPRHTPTDTPKPPSRSIFRKEWKCPSIDGKEEKILGVTYKIFCNYLPTGKAVPGGMLHNKDPEFLLSMCSVDRNCQGIRSHTSTAEMMLNYEYPPTERNKYSGWWSAVPVNRKGDTSAMVPDPFSQSTDGQNSPGSNGDARCPSIDGKLLSIGDDEFQVNCRRNYNPRNVIPYSNIRSFRECMVMCTLEKGCQGVRYAYGCYLILEHESLERSTPQNELSRTDSFVAMLTVPRSSSQV